MGPGRDGADLERAAAIRLHVHAAPAIAFVRLLDMAERQADDPPPLRGDADEDRRNRRNGGAREYQQLQKAGAHARTAQPAT